MEQETIHGAAQEPVQSKQNETRDTAMAALREARERREQEGGTGRFVLLPTEALTLRAEAYFYQYVEDVARLLNASGITDIETVEQVLQDYSFTLMGFFGLISLPIEKQANVVIAVKPWKLYLTERYGLNLLFSIYYYNTAAAKDYLDEFKLATGNAKRTTIRRENGETIKETEHYTIPVEEQKRRFLNNCISRIKSGTAPLYAWAYNWIRGVKTDDGAIVEPSDFSGIEPELTNQFFAYVEGFAGIDEYVNYYYIAKYALKATPDELREIGFPPLFQTFDDAQEYAERIGDARYKRLQRRAAEVEKIIDAETVEEREQARKEVISETPEPQDTVRIPETFALLGSRDVYATASGTEHIEGGILPIKKVIKDYMKHHNLTEQVTPRTVEKVIEGVNLLQRLYNVKPNEKGQYTFETNLTEFSELIGYKDANQTEKLEIMRALQVLDGLYLAVWRSDGLHAVRVFTIQDIGLKGEAQGKITLQVNGDAMKGRPNLISYKDFDAMRKASKGQAEAHFRYQILSKGQKEENALLNEVFGYETLLKEIQLSGGTADDITKAKRNIDKHKSRDKRRVAKWFEEYKQRGWLVSYTYTRNPKGDNIYKWRRGNIPQEQGTTPTQEPEEQ